MSMNYFIKLEESRSRNIEIISSITCLITNGNYILDQFLRKLLIFINILDFFNGMILIISTLVLIIVLYCYDA